MARGCVVRTSVVLFAMLLPAAARVQAGTPAERVPISGFQPQVVFGLTTEQGDELDFFQYNSSTPGGSMLPLGSDDHFAIGLYDTGAGLHLLRDEDTGTGGFNIAGAGFGGTESFPIGGVGQVLATVEDPLGLYVAGLDAVTHTAPLTVNTSALRGTTNTSVATAPPESRLPNIIGLPLASQYMTVIRNDQPHLREINGATVRSPQLELLPLGSTEGPSITRKAPMQLLPGDSFLLPPIYFPNFDNAILGLPFNDNPVQPTAVGGGMYLTLDLTNGGTVRQNVLGLFDSGATSTVVSELLAITLGIDPVLDTPDFTVPVGGVGDTRLDVPGYIIDALGIATGGGTFQLQNVPVLVLNLPNPADPANTLPALIGTNLFNDRNLVINPQPGDAYLAISDPIVDDHAWASPAPSAAWSAASSWNDAGTPSALWMADVINVTGADQEAVIAADSTVHQMAVAGGAATMTVRVQSGATLTVFGVVQVSSGGAIALDGGTVGALSVEINGGVLSGHGDVAGEVVNTGTVAPDGRLAIGKDYLQIADGILQIDIAGPGPGTGHDQVAVSGSVASGGTLAIHLAAPFSPDPGQRFDVVTWSGHNGTFDEVTGQHLGAGFHLALDYGTDGLALVATQAPAGDINFDGLVDDLDVTLMAPAFATFGDNDWLSGDFNADLWVDFGDLALMAANWSGASGVSAGELAAVIGALRVPEPGTLLLLAAASTLLMRRRRAGAGRRCALRRDAR